MEFLTRTIDTMLELLATTLTPSCEPKVARRRYNNMAGLEKVTTSSRKPGCVLRHYYHELHSLLSQSPTTLKDLTCRYYSVHFIDVNVESAITVDSSGPRDGARILLDHLEFKIEQCSDYLSSILAIMKSLAPLRDIVRKMESSSHERSSDRPIAITVMALNDGVSVLSQQPTTNVARRLKELFETLTVDIQQLTHSINVAEIKLSIRFRIQGGEGMSRMSSEVQRLVFLDLEATSTVDGIIGFMSSRGLIGYLNWTLLKYVFQSPFLLDQTTLGMIDAYERQHKQFIRGNLSTLLAVFKSQPDLAPVSVTGLPEIKVTLNESWKCRSLYQWNELMADIGILPDHLMITATAIEMNCATVTLTYAVLPCFVSTVTSILSDVKITKALVNVGVAFTINEELLKMGSLDTKHHELLIRNATAMIGHSSTTLVLNQQQHQTNTQQACTQEINAQRTRTPEVQSKPVAQPPPPPLEGGYDDEMFLSPPPKDLQCIVCNLIVCDPQLISCCGAIVCKICMLLSNASTSCPQCRHENSNIVPDKRTKGQTMGLKVKCTKGDCTWTGELVNYHCHIKERCPYRIIECQYGCGNYYTPSDITIHEEEDCTKRPYDVIMSHQERLLEAVEMKHSSQISDFEARITEMENEKATAQTNIMKLEEKQATLELEMAQLKADLKDSHAERLKAENGNLVIRAQLVHLESQQKSIGNKLQEKKENQQLLELQSENDEHKREILRLESQQAKHKRDKEKYEETHLNSLKKSQEQQLGKLKLKMARNRQTTLLCITILVLGLAMLPYVTYTYGTGHMETIHRQEMMILETERDETLAQLREIQNEKKIMEQTHSQQSSELEKEKKTQTELRELIVIRENEASERLTKMQNERETLEQMHREQINDLKEENREIRVRAELVGIILEAQRNETSEWPTDIQTIHRQEMMILETERDETLAQLRKIQNEKEIMERTHSQQISELEKERKTQTELRELIAIRENEASERLTKMQNERETLEQIHREQINDLKEENREIRVRAELVGIILEAQRNETSEWPTDIQTIHRQEMMILETERDETLAQLRKIQNEKEIMERTHSQQSSELEKEKKTQTELRELIVIRENEASERLTKMQNERETLEQMHREQINDLKEENREIRVRAELVGIILEAQKNETSEWPTDIQTIHRQEMMILETERDETLAQLREIQDEKEIMERTHSQQISELEKERKTQTELRELIAIRENEASERLTKMQNERETLEQIHREQINDLKEENREIKARAELVEILEAQRNKTLERLTEIQNKKESINQTCKEQISGLKEEKREIQKQLRELEILQTAFGYVRRALPAWYKTKISNDVPHCVRAMVDYTKHKQNNESWYSQPFYTKVGGYKLRLRVDTDRDHIGVGLYLMRGDNDDGQKWPFSGSITVRLLNWREDQNHIDHTFTAMPGQSPYAFNRIVNDDPASGHLIMYEKNFISHKQLLLAKGNTQYLMDDVMSFVIARANYISGYDPSIIPVWCHQELSSLHYGILPVYRTIEYFNKHRENNDVIYTDPFYTSNGGYKLTLAVHPKGRRPGKGTHVSVYVHLMKGPNDDNLQFPITGVFTIQILKWTGNYSHLKKSILFDDSASIEYRERIITGERAGGWGIFRFISREDLKSRYTAAFDEWFGMMSFKISFDPIIQTGQPVPSWIDKVQSTSATPPCTRTMYSYGVYSKTNSQWYSQPFYSSDKGYKLQLRVDANGDGLGKGTHLSLYVYLMKGEYDYTLSWPFNATITVQLLNWSANKHHEEKNIDYRNVKTRHYRKRVLKKIRNEGIGHPQFISHTKLQDSTFIANDNVCFRISEVLIQ